MKNRDDLNKTKKISVKELLKYIFTELKPFKKNIIIATICICIIAINDIFSAYLSKVLVDNYIVAGSMEGIEKIIYLIIILVIITCIALVLYIYHGGYTECYMPRNIRKDLFVKIQKLPLKFFDTNASGWIIARLTSDLSKLGEVLSFGITDVIWAFTSMLFSIILMFIVDVKLALIVIAGAPIMVILAYSFEKTMIKKSRELRKVNAEVVGMYSEGIYGAKTSKTLVIEELNLEEFKTKSLEYRKKAISMATVLAIFIPLIVSVTSIIKSFVLTTGASNIIKGSVTAGTVLLFIKFSDFFFEPVERLTEIFATFQQAHASLERAIDILEQDEEIFDNDEVIEKYASDKKTVTIEDVKKLEFNGDIEFRNVNFSYVEGEEVLKNVNLKIKKGQKIALVGETGAGKSTLASLVCRFYEPTDGEVLIDGINYKNMPLKWVRNNLGYVLQTPFLFSTSIKENIRYAKEDATDEEIIEACKKANCHDLIMKLKDKYDTIVGEQGSMLSSGERQLISFARVILKNPKLFVLDEATSSVDTNTEKIIQDTINTILEDRTSIIIAHRLSTIKLVDRILVVKNGNIVEDGSHKELIKKKGMYYNLYKKQYIKEEVW